MKYNNIEVPKPKVLLEEGTETFHIFFKNGDRIFFRALLFVSIIDDSSDAKIYHWASIKYSDFQILSETGNLHISVDLLERMPSAVQVKNPFVKFSDESDIPLICNENKNESLISITKEQWNNVLNQIIDSETDYTTLTTTES